MNKTDWMAVYALWQHRVLAGRYISDVQPYNLTPTERERLIVDSLYCGLSTIEPVDPFHFRKMKLSRVALGKHGNATLDRHLAYLKKR